MTEVVRTTACHSFAVRCLTDRRARAMIGMTESLELLPERAIVAQQLVNCLTSWWVDEAIERAKKCDKLREEGHRLGPLHGLPVSLKDQFQIKGKECVMGFVSWVGKISPHTAELVNCLEQAGAVTYCHTNVPQTLLRCETANWVFGRTLNPYNRSCTSGGSSGGEGALIAMGGSILGAGTDIGGSVRIPAAFNGLYGLRPTMRRLPYAGAANTLLGMEHVESSIGPLASSLSGLKAFFKGILDVQPWDYDAKVPYIPWRDEEYQLEKLGGRNCPLAFGVYDFDGYAHVQPPMRRALRMTVEALRAAGHEVIEWTPKDFHAAEEEVNNKAYSSDGGRQIKAVMNETGEPFFWESTGSMFSEQKRITTTEAWGINQTRDQLRQNMLKQWMSTSSKTATGRPIDALIAPAMYGPAPKHDGVVYWGSTVVFNALDMPSTVIPVTKASLTLDSKEDHFKPVNRIDQVVHDAWNPSDFAGLPCGVQIVGRRFQEEALLGLSEIVDGALASVRTR